MKVASRCIWAQRIRKGRRLCVADYQQRNRFGRYHLYRVGAGLRKRVHLFFRAAAVVGCKAVVCDLPDASLPS